MPTPIDFPAEAQAALVEAWELCDSALTAATMRFRPSNAYTPSTGANVVTWGAEITGKKVLKWEQELKRPDTGDRRNEGQAARLTETKVLIRDLDITPEVPAADSEIEMAGSRWKVASVETPPTAAFYVLTVRK
jgi:hypothetical protein